MTKVQRGIQSIEVGGQLLRSLAASPGPMALRDLARESAMDASKAHRYLVSFVKLGLVAQEADSGAYGLGPLAAQLGIAALRRFDPLREATIAAGALVAQIGHTVAIAVHGPLGPTVVRIEESDHALHVNMRVGTVMSLLNTATGLVFAAWLPPAETSRMLRDEAIRLYGERPRRGIDDAMERTLRDVRRHGLARAVGKPIPGINAISAPIFDVDGRVVLALTALGPSGTFDAAWTGALARAVSGAADAVSRGLGAPDRAAIG